MALGPGKYDDALTLALKLAGAQTGVLIVFGGRLGAGFAVQSDYPTLQLLPDVLESVARQIRADLESGKT